MKNVNLLRSEDLVDYEDALFFMEDSVSKIQKFEVLPFIWTLEHLAVFTAGNLTLESDFLDNTVKIVRTSRGGRCTWHGPGQLIVYLMLDLKALFYPLTPDVKKFVHMIEELIIKALKYLHIDGFRLMGRPGIYVFNKYKETRKIASLGIKIKKWISYHGLAINVNCELEEFSKIKACGTSSFPPINLVELGVHIKTKNFNEYILKAFQEVFNLKINYINCDISFNN